MRRYKWEDEEGDYDVYTNPVETLPVWLPASADDMTMGDGGELETSEASCTA
jgi:hypothetical protein